jgi:seryl-tRNA synthetase
MIDIEHLRENPQPYKDSMKLRNMNSAIVDEFLTIDKQWRTLLNEVEQARALQKKYGAERKIEEAKKLKTEISEKEKQVETLETKRIELVYQIPNLLHPDVPAGKDESENKVIRKWGEPTKFSFKPLDHVALGEKLGLLDSERAVKVSGARFVYLKGALAKLQMGIIQFVFDTLTDEKVMKKLANSVEKGFNPKLFVPVIPPVMIKPEPYVRMARLSPADKDERYHFDQDDLYLIGSAEHTLGSMYMDEILKAEDMPIRYIGYSTSFRREAGSYGKDTKGILRMHQFDKLEMESFTLPEDSEKEQRLFIAIQEYLLQQLELPYQVVQICTGDMGKPDARQVDMETWMPGQDRYRETHTSDLMTDYQTRRLATKIRKSDGTTVYAHTNDATAFAIGRILIAIMENNQTEKGTIKIPKVLQKYSGVKEIV